MFVKAKVAGTIIDITDLDGISRATVDDNNYLGTILHGIVYPLRGVTDTRPGIYKCSNLYMRVVKPDRNEIDSYRATSESIVDFDDTKSIRDIITAKNKFRKMESTVLTSVDNITTPIIDPNDAPEMKALKEAIIAKHIDLNKYEARFGPNFNNDRRLLDKNSITLTKLKSMGDALDIEVSLTLRDKSPSVPNPMGKVITVTVTGEDESK